MNAVQVVENLLVEGSQFIVQPNDPVKSAFVTFGSVRAAAAILALVKFYGSPILVRYFLSLVSFSYMGNFMYFSIPCSWQYR